ncbi:MAG: adenylosuccinate synthase, partial [Thermoanaerobaculia bacterium]|nr:adenylosuccinate synthase [Thermoanaerobaculia bacterium]
WAERLAPMLIDTASRLNGWIKDGRGLLFEGAQGALLDIDHGTFPFVTSSNTTAGGVATGTGVPPTRLDAVLGVVKAYSTRVGGGPFTTELLDATGEHLRRRGNEFGTTTGRPRRCGWFDAVAVRYAGMLSGVTAIALTKLDVLDELDEILLCTGYRYRGETFDTIPAELEVLAELEPVYRRVLGWRQSTVGVLERTELPQAAQDYVRILEDEVGAPAVMISTGPRREETILCDHPELAHVLGDRRAEVVRFRDGR